MSDERRLLKINRNGTPVDEAAIDTIISVLPSIADELLADARQKIGKGLVPEPMQNEMVGRALVMAAGLVMAEGMLSMAKDPEDAKIGADALSRHLAAIALSAVETSRGYSAVAGAPFALMVGLLFGGQIYCGRLTNPENPMPGGVL